MNWFVGDTAFSELFVWFLSQLLCSLTCRQSGHWWKMVTYIWRQVRATVLRQRERSACLYLFRSPLQGLWCQLPLQRRLPKVLLSMLCLRLLFTTQVQADHLLHHFCSLACISTAATGRRCFKTLLIKPTLGTSLTSIQYTSQKSSSALLLKSWRHHTNLFL